MASQSPEELRQEETETAARGRQAKRDLAVVDQELEILNDKLVALRQRINAGLTWQTHHEFEDSGNVICSELQVIGQETDWQWVCAYSFSSLIQATAFPIKVGMTKAVDPIGRIKQQFGTSNPEAALVLMLARCRSATQMEAWLHSRLIPTDGCVGREWFSVRLAQLSQLMEQYLENEN